MRNPIGPLPAEAALVVPPHARAHRTYLEPGQPDQPQAPRQSPPAAARRRAYGRDQDHER